MVHSHTISFENNPDVDYNNYDILIDTDLLPRVIDHVKTNVSKRRQAIVADGNVIHGGHLKRLDPNGEVPVIKVHPDMNGGVESQKNVDTYGRIIDFLDQNKFEKNDTLVCLGGGVIGDMGGFVAGTYKRGGMTYIQVPTTTLSQADSSVGGKCAIDSGVSKNAASCFYQPHFVAQDISSLLTQDSRNFYSGLAESVKHGIILDKDYFGFLEESLEGIRQRDKEVLELIAFNNVKLKGSVVEQDPTEKNYRKSLNFGHTIGHAVESASEYGLYHGEAVSFGMLGALHISRAMGDLTTKEFDRVQDLLINGLGMPDRLPSNIERATVEDLLSNDKKCVDSVPQFVRVDHIGRLHSENGHYASPIPKKILNRALDYIF